jgi:hypothetical protein
MTVKARNRAYPVGSLANSINTDIRRTQERSGKKTSFDPRRRLPRTGVKRHLINHYLQYPDEQLAGICLNKCQIPRLHIFVNGLFTHHKKMRRKRQTTRPAINGSERRLNQNNLGLRINETTAVGVERMEYRLQSAWLDIRAQPTKVVTLNALPRWFVIPRYGQPSDGAFSTITCRPPR